MKISLIKELRDESRENHGAEYEQQLQIVQTCMKQLEKLPEEVREIIDRIEEEYWILKDIEIEESFIHGFQMCMQVFRLGSVTD